SSMPAFLQISGVESVLPESITTIFLAKSFPIASKHPGRFFSSFLAGMAMVKSSIFTKYIITFFYGFTRVSRADHPFRHIFPYYCAGPNYGAISYVYTRVNKRLGG